MVVINPLFRLHPIIFCVLTHSKTEWMWLIYFTPHNQFSNWCISLTDAFRQFWRFLTPPPPYLTPTAVLIISLNKPPLNNVYPIRYDLIFLAEEFRRFLWFLFAVEQNSAYYFLCPDIFCTFTLSLRALFCSSKTNFIRPYVFNL